MKSRYYIRVRRDLNPIMDYLIRRFNIVHNLSKRLSIWTCYDPMENRTVYSMGTTWKKCNQFTIVHQSKRIGLLKG